MSRLVERYNGGARPFLKWAGGKGQLLAELTARLPERWNVYHEPFVGSGALFFHLKATKRLGKARLSDINPELINAWVCLRDRCDEVIAELRRFSRRLTKEDFYDIRALDPASLPPARRAARLLYLNKTCFNGLYRENGKGQFNVPYGRYANPKVLDGDNLRAVSRALQGVEIEQAPFATVLERAQPGDFVYLDPPYHPLSTSSSFTAYSKGGFGEAGQRELAAVFRQLVERGVHVLLSNSDTPLIRELYGHQGYEVSVVQAARAINSKADRRGAINELLVSATGRSLSRGAAERARPGRRRIAFGGAAK